MDGKYSEAAPRLERAITAGLDLADRIRAREWLAVCYFFLSQPAKSSESIQALVKEAPAYEPSATLTPDVREFFTQVARESTSRAALEAELLKLRAPAKTTPDPGTPRPASTPAALASLSGAPFEWVDIRGGTFQMGCGLTDRDCVDHEVPAHRQVVAAFRMMATEVTLSMYQAYASVAGRAVPVPPRGGYRADLPLVNVTWLEALGFCEWVNGRLPTEAEWEYAARAGTSTVYWWGDSFEASRANASGNVQPAGNARRNPFGLYDMLGNVWEWTSTVQQPYPYNAADGREDRSANGPRVIRGGSWNAYPIFLRASSRGFNDPGNGEFSVGFRCAQSAS
jgi:formylglycine-generating enzyme required for sulfatase activity